ncbi:MAG: acyl-protein synthetase [Candidatus Scalindua sp. AMX11]|nr:MAG: acyl-protein synthetase [Candidatus Scalindua sp.]NOG82689.1 acyl-protein synthetase [Planctomycetota bacterium]RZV95263.1 MAG: acyl-protein synthetase [Candidatus Scalindua sp. SCAELEC01]TDE66257.1 MAG: acyl-protein synthetase [Candidatus Scalindua sp. AMX11]GJQ57880.1 MAG: acyl-protein synthetase [Candidatus Scalindua sp.]
MIEEYFLHRPFSLTASEKGKQFLDRLIVLHRHHSERCSEYRNIYKAFGRQKTLPRDDTDFIPLPVRLFKTLTLKSVNPEDVQKTLTSSGTTSQNVSHIYLDKETSRLQTKVLAHIINDYIGTKRLPMLIIDTEDVIKDRQLFSARGGGILGFSTFGRNHLYLFDSEMNIKVNELKGFCDRFKEQPVLLFGFTFLIWKYFVEVLKANNQSVSLPHGILIHSGGWKKLKDDAVDNETFKTAIRGTTGIQSVYNFYGMVEQLGSIFMECERGFFHTCLFNNIVIRNWKTLKVCQKGEEGIIEVQSVIPWSYPGHVLITEDLGVLIGEDNCECGRKGKYFVVNGRIPVAELRGCSDTFQHTG